MAETTKWLPIETAPDETPIWLLDAEGSIWIGERCYEGDGWLWGNCYFGIYHLQNGGWASNNCEIDDDYQPTHWMPLPTARVSPPAAQEEGEAK